MLRTPTVRGRRVLVLALPRTWRGWAPLGRCLLAGLVPLWVWPVMLILVSNFDFDSVFEDGLIGRVASATVFITTYALPFLLGFACLPRFSTRLHWRLGAALIYAAVMGPAIGAWWVLLEELGVMNLF